MMKVMNGNGQLVGYLSESYVEDKAAYVPCSNRLLEAMEAADAKRAVTLKVMLATKRVPGEVRAAWHAELSELEA